LAAGGGKAGGARHERGAGAHDPAADDGRPRHDAASLGGRSALRRTKNVPVPFETGSPSASLIAVSRYATWRASRTTSPRTDSTSPACAARIVEYLSSSVAARSPDPSAAFVPRLMRASC